MPYSESYELRQDLIINICFVLITIRHVCCHKSLRPSVIEPPCFIVVNVQKAYNMCNVVTHFLYKDVTENNHLNKEMNSFVLCVN